MADRARPQRLRWIAARLAAVAGLVAVSLLAAPGTASAYGTVTPLLDCVTQHGNNGSYTAVLGYSNTTGRSQTIAYGPDNVITPSRYDRAQPSTFQPGTYHGVFTIKIPASDVWSSPSWTLNGHRLDAYDAYRASACPPGTQMPSVGNGAGAAIGLGAAGLVGAVLVRRYVRRARQEGSRA
jgi:hypothetical protein